MRNSFLIAALFFIFPSAAYAAIVNINTATAVQLDTLPGIGPSKAAAIVDYRAGHGPFVKIEDIQNVKGIGPSTYAGLKSSITVESVTMPAAAVQPTTPIESSHTKQTVEHPIGYFVADPAATTKISQPTHAKDAARAPGTTSELAASGAALSSTPVTPAGAGDVAHSYWTLSFLAIVVLAGGVLVIL